MLKRVLEPEVMDTPEEALAYDSMDHNAVNQRFVEDFLSAAAAAKISLDDAEVLDLGTGTALIPIELCRQQGTCRVLAIDLSVHMLNLAKGNIEVAGLRERIMLDRVDGKQLPYADGRFAAVNSNSIVHHIPQPASALTEAWRVLAPGGMIFVRDLLRPDSEAEVRHLVDTYAAGATPHQRQLFDDSLRAALTLDEVRALVTKFDTAASSVDQTSDRHWTWRAVKTAKA
jgi:ubiquinone/menaquinone biosynthesis C-methylase UbiE